MSNPRVTKVPGFGIKAPAGVDPALRKHLDAITEALAVRLGMLGDPLDRAVTARELVNAGVISTVSARPFDPNTPSTSGIVSAAPFADTTIPTQPTGVTAGGGYSIITVFWDLPTYSNHSYTEIWRNSANVLGDAVLIGTSGGQTFVDPAGESATYYYWIRHVSNADIRGPYNATLGTSATTSSNVSELLTELTGAISASQLTAGLLSMIDGAGSAIDLAAIQTFVGYDSGYTGDPLLDLITANETLLANIEAYSGYTSGYTGDPLLTRILASETDITALETTVNNGTTGVAATASAVTALTTRVTATESTNTSQGASITSAQSAITTLQGTVNNPTTGVAATAAALSSLTTTVTTQGTSITSAQSAITTLQGTVNNPTTGVAALNTAVSTINSTLTTHGTDITAAQSAITTLQSTVNNGTTGVAALNTALTALTSTVTAHGTDITAAQTSITALQSTVNNPTTGVAALNTAISTLSSTVATHGTDITAAQSAITTLQGTVNNGTTGVTALNTAVNALGTRMTAAEGSITVNSSDIAALNSSVYNPTTGLSATASALSTLTTTVNVTQAGQISTLSGQYTTLSTTVSGHTSTISSHTASIDGLSAEYMVKINVDGRVSGFGLYGGTESEFVILADRFSIVSQLDDTMVSVPFTVQATPTTINGVAVAAGIYVTDAFIKNGSIVNAKIGDAAIDDAKIANLSADKITTGTLDTSVLNIDGATVISDAGVLKIGLLQVDNLDANSVTTEKLTGAAVQNVLVSEVFTGNGLPSDASFEAVDELIITKDIADSLIVLDYQVTVSATGANACMLSFRFYVDGVLMSPTFYHVIWRDSLKQTLGGKVVLNELAAGAQTITVKARASATSGETNGVSGVTAHTVMFIASEIKR